VGKYYVEGYTKADGKVSETPFLAIYDIKTVASARKKIRDFVTRLSSAEWRHMRFRVRGPEVDSWFAIKLDHLPGRKAKPVEFQIKSQES
jgi:hypothetical protein